MSKLVKEFNGFLKFLRRANHEVVSWFGPHCKYDPCGIAFMAARQWEAMADSERVYFIKAHKLESRQRESRSNPYLCFLLHKRHNNFPGSSRTSNNGIVAKSLFQPEYGRANGLDWMAMSGTEREKYANMNVADLGIDHVIEKRDKLYEIYDPKELNILEFILKTKPKRPSSARTWFFTMESLRFNSPCARERWHSLSQDDRRFYNVCYELDKKRFQYEKSAWLTRLLSTDFERDDLTLNDFESIRAKSDVETIVSLMKMNLNLLPNFDRPKRPLGPFSLFVRDYRYQIRNQKPGFRFGQHLRETSEAWAKLSGEEKQFYKDISKELRKSFNESNEKYLSATSATDKNLCELLFKHEKSITGPSRPSHLINRVPTVEDMYGRALGLRKQDRKKSWDALSDSAKEPYILKHEQLKIVSESQRAQTKKKYDYIKDLIRKSEELMKLKRELKLLRSKNRVIKGIND